MSKKRGKGRQTEEYDSQDMQDEEEGLLRMQLQAEAAARFSWEKQLTEESAHGAAVRALAW